MTVGRWIPLAWCRPGGRGSAGACYAAGGPRARPGGRRCQLRVRL